MNTTSYTFESVHGIKQTVVLMPNTQNQATPEPSIGQGTPDSTQQYDDEQRTRSSK